MAYLLKRMEQIRHISLTFTTVALCGLMLTGTLSAEAARPPQEQTTAKEAAKAPAKKEEQKKEKQPAFTEAELKAARRRTELRQISARLVVAHKYEIKGSIPGLMRRLKKIAPDSPEDHYFSALQLYQSGEKGRALLLLKEAVYKQPHFARAWNLRGVILSEANRLPESREAFAKAVAVAPYDPVFIYNLASVTYRMNQKSEALGQARRAVQLKPNLGEGYYLQGMIHRDLNEKGQALLAFKEASRFGEDSPRFWLDYMLVAEAAGEEKTVLDIAARLARNREPDVLRELARVHIRYGEYRRAVGYLSALSALPEANLEDKKRFIFALHRSGARVVPRIDSLPRLSRDDRKELLRYYTNLRSGNAEALDARDPLLAPVK